MGTYELIIWNTALFAGFLLWVHFSAKHYFNKRSLGGAVHFGIVLLIIFFVFLGTIKSNLPVHNIYGYFRIVGNFTFPAICVAVVYFTRKENQKNKH